CTRSGRCSTMPPATRPSRRWSAGWRTCRRGGEARGGGGGGGGGPTPKPGGGEAGGRGAGFAPHHSHAPRPRERGRGGDGGACGWGGRVVGGMRHRNLVILALAQIGVLVGSVLAAGAAHKSYTELTPTLPVPPACQALTEYGWAGLALPVGWLVATAALFARS